MDEVIFCLRSDQFEQYHKRLYEMANIMSLCSFVDLYQKKKTMAFPMNTDLHQMTATMHIYSMHFSQYKPAVMEDSCVCVCRHG